MGTSTSKCCCREQANAEKATEALGNAPTHFTVDEPSPITDRQKDALPSAVAQSASNEEKESTSVTPRPAAVNDDEVDVAPPPAADNRTAQDVPSGKRPDAQSGKARRPDTPAAQTKRVENKAHGKQDEAGVGVAPQSELQQLMQQVDEDQIAKPEEQAKLFGFPGMTMQVLLETGWTEFGKDELKQMSDHLQAGTNKFPMTSRGALYVIDMSDRNSITQTNAGTKKIRKCRLIKESEITVGGDEIQGEVVAPPMSNTDENVDKPSPDQPHGRSKRPGPCCCVVS